MFMRIRARWAPRCNGFDDICWTQRLKSFQPKTSFLRVRMSKLVRLNSLCVFRQTEHFARHWVFYADFGNVSPPEAHEQISALNAKHHSAGLKLMPFPKVTCASIRQVCARRVSNEQVPLANVMRYAIHRHDLPPLQSLERIAQDVSLRMPARRLLNVAGVGFVTFCPERLADFLRFLTSN